MAPPKRRSPGVGRGIGDNSNLPSQAEIRKALAQEVIDKQKIEAANELRKQNRKAAEGKGIPLAHLDKLFKKKDMTAEEVEAEIRLDIHFAAALHDDIGTQFDIFAPKPDAPERRAAYYHVGLMAGLKGDANTPPPGLMGDALQQYQSGWNDGNSARNEAMKDEADRQKEAGKTASLADLNAAGDRAAKDDPLVVDGERYPNKRAADAARKRLEQRQADEAAAQTGGDDAPAPGESGDTPAEPPPASEADADAGRQPGEQYAGKAERDVVYALSSDEPLTSGRVKTYMNGTPYDSAQPDGVPMYDEHPDAEPAVGAEEPFEATEEELAQQAGRKKQEAEPLDEAEIAAQAKALKESGFLPGEKTKGRARK